MRVLQGIGIVVLALLVLLGLLYLRRALIARGGTIEMSWRLSTLVPGRGWSPGLARFVGDELRWYRMFSFSIRPSRVVSRRALRVETRRPPDGPETLSLAPDWVVVRCASAQAYVEIAMADSTVAGFLSWIEAVPPGTVPSRAAAR